MIVWFNCKITDIRPKGGIPGTYGRFNLRPENRFDIARYSFASYVPLAPIVSKFIFNLEMADGHAHQQQEMEHWLTSIFPPDKLILNWFRVNHLAQWRQFQAFIANIDDPLIMPAGNEDHIFMASNINLIAEGLELIKTHPQTTAVLGITHYPECIRSSYFFGGPQPDHHRYFVSFRLENNDSMRVMKREFFNWYVDQIKNPDALMFRTEDWNSIRIPSNLMFTTTAEQFRHFDGYSHVRVGPEIAPPLEIPPGFFNKEVVIRYGFEDRDSNCVNINPLAEKLYAADINGADYKFTLDDIPLFWKPYIKEIIVADNIDNLAMDIARDKYYIDLTKVKIDWHHVGIKFDETNEPPLQWIQPHMKVLVIQ